MDVLKATFPAGTLSGAPKIRAMEIIEELEPERRSLYGGHVVIFLLQKIWTSDSNSNGGLKKRHFKCSSWSRNSI